MTSTPQEAWRNRTDPAGPNCPPFRTQKDSLDLMEQELIAHLLQGNAALDRLRDIFRVAAAAAAVVEEQTRPMQAVRPLASKPPMEPIPEGVGFDGDITEHLEPLPHGIFGYLLDLPTDNDD